MAVLVVGAGISGVACAAALRAAGITVEITDRGLVPGGRMASRRWDGRIVDLGASYLTIDDPKFRTALKPQLAAGTLRPWTDTFAAYEDGTWTAKAGPLRYAAAGGLRSVVTALAADLEMRLDHVVGSVGPGPACDGVAYDAVVLAMPTPQAVRLLDSALVAERNACAAQRWDPVLAVAASFLQVPGVLGDGVFVNGGEVLSFVAHDGRRRGDMEPVVVAHTTAPFASRHLQAPDEALPAVLEALESLLGTEAKSGFLHRWSLARPSETSDLPYFLGASGVALCGDGFTGGDAPKVETAWRSGHLLGVELVRQLG